MNFCCLPQKTCGCPLFMVLLSFLMSPEPWILSMAQKEQPGALAQKLLSLLLNPGVHLCNAHVAQQNAWKQAKSVEASARTPNDKGNVHQQHSCLCCSGITAGHQLLEHGLLAKMPREVPCTSLCHHQEGTGYLGRIQGSC